MVDYPIFFFFSLGTHTHTDTKPTHTGGNKITFYSFRNEEPRPHLKRNPKGKPLRQLSLSQRALINATNAQPATCFDISRDSQLAAVAAGRTVQIWQINSPQLTQTLDNHTALVTCARFSPNCELIASGGEDKVVVVWNLVFGLIVTTFKVRENRLFTGARNLRVISFV